MKKLFLLSVVISPFMLSAELVDEVFFDQESEEVAILEEQEISYLSDNNGGYTKRSTRPAQPATIDEYDDNDEEYEEPVCRPKPRPQCRPKPQCREACAPKPRCRPPVMYKTVTKRVKCCDRKEEPEPCAGLMFPSAHGSMLQCGADIDVFGEWLYYQVSEAGLVYTANGNTALINPPDENIVTPVVMQPGYHSGFRVGFDADINSDDWQLMAAWTRFHQHSSYSHPLQRLPTDGPFDNLAAYFYYPENAVTRTSASASWKFNYDVLDVVLGRDCYLGRKLFIKPYAGFRGAYITQTVDATYFNPPGGTTPFDRSYYATGKQTFRGAGMKFGADLHWMFAKRFGLYTDISTSLLWATYNTNLTNSNSVQVPPTLQTPMNVKSIQSVIEMGAGFELDTYFACDRYHLVLRAGWEESLWLAHNHMFQAVRFTDGSTRNATYNSAGQLALSGAVAGIKLGF